MRLFERYFETIKVAPLTEVTGALGSNTAAYGTKVSVLADVQPVSSAAIRAEYGERADRIRQMFMPLGTDISIGDGVWLAADTLTDPPWRVVSVSQWKTHVEANIERRDAIA